RIQRRRPHHQNNRSAGARNRVCLRDQQCDPDPATGTSVDLLEVRQKNGAGYDVLESRTINAQHLPLTVTDAARQTTTFTYRTTGDLETIVTPPRGTLTPAQRTTTFTYYADNATLGPGRVQRITGPVTGATTKTENEAKRESHPPHVADYARPDDVTNVMESIFCLNHSKS